MLRTKENVELLACLFVLNLTIELTATEFAQMKRLNSIELEIYQAVKQSSDGQPQKLLVCHSHDFVDANAVMLRAFKQGFPEVIFDFENNEHIELINSAWFLARLQGRI